MQQLNSMALTESELVLKLHFLCATCIKLLIAYRKFHSSDIQPSTFHLFCYLGLIYALGQISEKQIIIHVIEHSHTAVSRLMLRV